MELSLKKLAIRGATWALLGYGATQVLRFASNIVLTKLLVPEMFGLMALVNVVLLGLQMFSDVGIGPSIVQNKRGEDPDFLNTAWTMQISRGIGIFLIGCFAAWPVAQFYGKPELAIILPFSSFTALIAGFNSTSLFTADRRIDLSRLTIVELVAQIVSIVVMISLAQTNPSVWALVIGGICGASAKMIMSHVWKSDIRNRIKWDKEAANSLVRFGRWIFLSTALGFVLKYGDQLILGKFLTTADLGIYYIATMLIKVIEQVLNRMAQKVLFPLYSKLNHLPPKELRPRVKKVRFALMGTLLPPLIFLAIFGPELIQFIYPSDYVNAGWMLQVLAAGLIVFVGSLIGPFYLAYGNSFLFMKLQAIRSVLLMICMAIGGHISGASGAICGVAATRLVFYPIQVAVYRNYNLWLPKLDMLGLLGSAGIISAGLWLKSMFLSPNAGLELRFFVIETMQNLLGGSFGN